MSKLGLRRGRSRALTAREEESETARRSDGEAIVEENSESDVDEGVDDDGEGVDDVGEIGYGDGEGGDEDGEGGDNEGDGGDADGDGGDDDGQGGDDVGEIGYGDGEGGDDVGEIGYGDGEGGDDDGNEDIFVDEPPVRHNELPDSSDDEGFHVEHEGAAATFEGGSLYLGQSFYSMDEFKKAVLQYALSTKSNIVQDRWEKKRVGFKCGIGGACPWKIYCSYDIPANRLLVKTFIDSHRCTKNTKCKILKSPAIARLFLDDLRRNENFMPLEIQKAIKDKWELSSSINQCQKGRLLALKMIKMEYEQQFAHLRGYCEEIRISNPGTTCEVETKVGEDGEDVFNRFYVCFDILRSSWRRTCRPIIGVDGCFLKTSQKGVLLTAIGRDPNNQIYPIAWAVVQSETGDNWVWFMKLLQTDLGLGSGAGYILISDRQKGLINASKEVLPQIEHIWCVKHIYENLKKKHGKEQLLKPLIWNLSWSYSEWKYDSNLYKIKKCSLALHNDVLKEDSKSWCRDFFTKGNCCEDVDNNFTESFNAAILKARDKSLVPMLETIRRQAMMRISRRRRKATKHLGIFSEYVEECLELERKEALKCQLFAGSHGLHEVELYGNGYSVNLRKGTCSCCKWEITGIPCKHAYGVILHLNLDVDDYISDYFSTVRWRDTYTTSILPVRGPDFWIRPNDAVISAPPEPILPGRKKESKLTKKKKEKKKQKQRKQKFPRIKGTLESPSKKTKKKDKLSRKGRIMHCSNCKETGHSAPACGKKKRKGSSYSQTVPKRAKKASSSSQTIPEVTRQTRSKTYQASQSSQTSNVFDPME